MKEKRKDQTATGIRFQLSGWILFIICAVLFILSGVKNHDPLMLIGSVIFFIACLVFIVPLIRFKG